VWVRGRAGAPRGILGGGAVSRQSRARAELSHPGRDEIDLLDILHALSDPTRMKIAQTLLESPERACGTFDVDVAPSTLSHHFRVLREAGVIRQREDGNRRWTSLRHEDLQERFPGLLGQIVGHYARTRRAAVG
jgi:DNA-binding transcriptional ArsR family regulator